MKKVCNKLIDFFQFNTQPQARPRCRTMLKNLSYCLGIINKMDLFVTQFTFIFKYFCTSFLGKMQEPIPLLVKALKDWSNLLRNGKTFKVNNVSLNFLKFYFYLQLYLWWKTSVDSTCEILTTKWTKIAKYS